MIEKALGTNADVVFLDLEDAVAPNQKVEARGKVTTKSGKPYNNSYCYVCRLLDGKLVEVTEYMDTEMAAAVLGPP